MSPIARRWLKFNFVGALGVGVQLAAFSLYKGAAGLDYLVATALAVETAVLHNFIWHERFTWRDLPGGTWRDTARRLVRFHAANGAISILGNLAFMRLLVGGLHMNPYIANGLAIAFCALLNFAASEFFVFRR